MGCLRSPLGLEVSLSEDDVHISSLSFISFETPIGIANISTETILQCVRIAVQERRLPPFERQQRADDGSCFFGLTPDASVPV